jgi:Spy/CpxP family protein refolding chaperone
MSKFRVGKILVFGLAMVGTLSAQPPRGPMATQDWWRNKVMLASLNLTEAQTKQLNSIQASYVGRLKELYEAVNKAESNLEEVFNQTTPDEPKAEAVIDQYANAKGDLTRTISRLGLQIRNVLTAEQWQDLQNLQSGRGPRTGPARGRRGTGPPQAGSAPKALGPSISQK